jgi:lysophospholipase L1-like esterase
MEWYEEEVRALERAHAQRPPPAGSAVFYGSSSLRLWGTIVADLAPWPVVNRAFGGSTLAACVHFFARLVPPCAPGSLVIYAGDNDLGDGRPPADVVSSLRALLTQVDAVLGPIPVAFMAIKPSPARWGLRSAIRQVNDAARQLLASRPRGHFIDTYHPMLGRDGQPVAALFAEDGLHLSSDGYRLWADILRCYGHPLLIR